MPPVVRTRGADASEEGVPRKRYSEPSSSSSQLSTSASAGSSGGVKVPQKKQFYSLSQVKSSADSKAAAGSTSSKKKRSADDGSSKEGGRSGKKAKRAGAASGTSRIRTPHEHDVLSGRGGGINSHPGNQRFREWVFERKNAYNLAPNKNEKSRVAQEIHDLVVSQDPPGRFLMREGGDKMKGRSGGPSLTSLSAISGGRGYWVEIDDNKAMAKTSQALREGAPSIRAAAREVKASGEAESRASGGRKKKSEPTRKAKSGTSSSTSRSKERKKRRDVPAVKKADARLDDDSKSQSSRIFPKIKSAPVPAPLSVPEPLVDAAGDEISLPMGPDASIARPPSGGSGGDLLTPEQVAAAEAHFRHGTLIGASIPGRGKEVIMPPPVPPMIPADTGLPPLPAVAMTHPDALRTESGEPREKFDEIQAAEAEKQLSLVLHLEQAMASTPPPPTETAVHKPYEAGVGVQSAGQQQQGEPAYTPTPHLLPTMSPVISPTYSFRTPTMLSNGMWSPNFSAMLASPGAGMYGNHMPFPPPPIHGPVATQANSSVGGSNLNRSHSLAASDSNSGIDAIDPHEDFKNIFEDEDSSVGHSTRSIGGVVQNHGGGNGAGSRNYASRQPTARSAPPPLATAGMEAASRASRAIVSPVLTSHPTSATTQGVAPIGQTEVARSSSNGDKKKSCQGSRKDMGRSSHSDTSRSHISDLSDLTDAKRQYTEPRSFDEGMREVYAATHPELHRDFLPPNAFHAYAMSLRNGNGHGSSSNSTQFSPLRRVKKGQKKNGVITP